MSAPERDQSDIAGEIEARISELEAADARQAGPIWGATHKLMLKAKVNPAEAGRIIVGRDLDQLRAVVARLQGEGAPAPSPVDQQASEPLPAADISHETLRHAMRAFRKRLKLTRLDHESKLGVGPMSGGRTADFDAIMPPRDYPHEVWEALAAGGELERAGKGFYMLPKK